MDFLDARLRGYGQACCYFGASGNREDVHSARDPTLEASNEHGNENRRFFDCDLDPSAY